MGAGGDRTGDLHLDTNPEALTLWQFRPKASSMALVFALPAFLAAIPWWVWAIIGWLVLLGIFDLVTWLIYALSGRCRLRKYILAPDSCEGPCPTASQVCTPAGTRPYGPFGLLGTQDIGPCTCGPPLGGGGGTGGTGGSGTSGSEND